LVHRRSVVRLLALQHPSFLETTAALPRVHGLSPAPSTTAAPPRPGPIGRRWTQPRASALAARCKGAEPGRFPCSLLTVCRSRRPTLSRRYRHGYAAVPSPWPSGPANTDLSGSSPLRHEGAGAHRVRPRSARFRAGASLRDVKRRFLSYTSASRLPDPTHLAVLDRPGFVAAAPTLTDISRVRLPPATLAPLRRGSRCRSFTSTRSRSAFHGARSCQVK
jgi:hypothetical protein